MLLVLCVDLDDDLGRKTGVPTPVVGRNEVEHAAVSLAEADPEDSDVNVLFEGVHLHDKYSADGEDVAVAAVTGLERGDVAANREVGREVDEVLATLQTDDPVRAVVVTDGAQDESVVPVIRSRVPIDAVKRVVVRQAQDLESMYYTLKQVMNDPETRGTILVPLGILLLIYPLAVLADVLGLPGAVLGVSSAAVGLYALFRGLGLERVVDDAVEQVRSGLYTGRVTLITYVVAAALLVIGGVEGANQLADVRAATPGDLAPSTVLAALAYGAVRWFAAAGLTTSLGQVTDEYLAGRFRWRYLNAPFYVLSIAAVLHMLSGFFLEYVTLTELAAVLTGGTLVSVLSTLTFAVIESWRARTETDAEAA
jgi:putative membrane protein